jgi:hypothetical protein
LLGTPDDISLVRDAKDEILDDLGLGHFAQVGVASLAASVQRRRFSKLRFDPEHLEFITDPGRVAEAKLIKKYKGIRFSDYDDAVDPASPPVRPSSPRGFERFLISVSSSPVSSLALCEGVPVWWLRL